MEAQVTWTTGLNFTGKSDSGFDLHLGAAQEGFRPMELFAIGLVGCTGMDVISILEKKRQVVTDFQVKVYLDRAAEHPKMFTHGRIEYRVTGHGIEEEAVLRSIELSTTRYCPAHAMFEQVFPIELAYSIYEDRGEGREELVASGKFTPQKETIE
jgi:putative redox protein